MSNGLQNFNISILTATFNRKDKLPNLIDSSIKLINKGIAKELVVVDDASTDNTFEMLQQKYSDVIASGILVVHRLQKNIGVTGARNIGVTLSSGDRIIIIDSDDVFLVDSGSSILLELTEFKDFDIIFFRCCDVDHKLIGHRASGYEININEFYNKGTPGECMPVIKKSVLLTYPFFSELRGGEGIAYIRMLHNGCRAYVSDKIARVYCTIGSDRLCDKDMIKKRSQYLFKNHYMKLKYMKYSTVQTFFGLIIRLVYYSYLSGLNKITTLFDGKY